MAKTHRLMGRRARQQRLKELMDRLGLGALLLRRPANFAWYTGGADNRVDHVSPFGVADVLITLDAEHIFTNNIEAPRMREEQTPNFEVIEHPWYEGEVASLREVVGDASLGTDFPLEGGADVSDEVAPLRYVLDPVILERYRRIGADAAAALKEAAGSVSPGKSGPEGRADPAG